MLMAVGLMVFTIAATVSTTSAIVLTVAAIVFTASEIMKLSGRKGTAACRLGMQPLDVQL